ncbi:probable 3-oxoacyl-[acyl-carrier-protein] reductase [Phialocephala subalpina]|uniref:Probable 3-oxoacyl-[acyl-carrier-protein] reductase n=1 Tax=Phialocephala subalpina TaxID=576137 RepID=A0A1L7X5V3_9HELO|nr:probable 3-oxoacyl-[acyl-carrier-protein] reductase [Phialocephala subalpina]
MSSIKDTIKSAVDQDKGPDSQFAKGHEAPTSFQDSVPGKQYEMPGPDPVNDQLPTDEGGYQMYKSSGKLAGKKALITGGDSGIGRAIAILYAMEGAESTIVYIPEEQKDAEETQQLVREKGGKVTLISADLRSQQACKNIVEKAIEAMGKINILCLNHGTQMMRETIAELPEEQWLDTFAVNIHPFFFISKYALPQMSRGDTIVTCASVNPYIGRPDLLDYTSTKGAIVAFTRGLANQLVEKGIRVNCVCPGPVWTPLIPATMNKKAQEQFTSPMGRPGQPSEIAACFVFLAGPDSSFISGQSLHPNGGVQVGS